MICPKCGSNVPEGKFCSSCGAILPENTADAAPSSGNTKKVIIIIVNRRNSRSYTDAYSHKPVGCDT